MLDNSAGWVFFKDDYLQSILAENHLKEKVGVLGGSINQGFAFRIGVAF